MYLAHIPAWLRRLYPRYIWQIADTQKVLYLTFDDGPTPEITDWVLDQLEQYEAKATFFLIGDRVRQFPELAKKVQTAGHQVGNHSHTHRNGWKTSTREYITDFEQAREEIENSLSPAAKLYRPPYGKIKRKQARQILQTHQIVMFDVLSGDFDPKLSAEQCYQNVIGNAGPGSIVVFHDSLKAAPLLKKVLPRVLQFYAEQGYRFAIIPA